MSSCSPSSYLAFRRVLAGGLVMLAGGLFMASLGGCSSKEPAAKDNVDSYESELRLVAPQYLGPIGNGETKTSYYYAPPRYRAFGFSAKGGDEITVDVKSIDGDALGWITTSLFDALAFNDDASPNTLDAKVVYKVPAGTPPRPYRIVFRDYDLLDATFTVKLSIVSGAVCTYNGASFTSGDSFPSTDGCNTCSCSASGSVACTKQTCACDPEVETWRNYVGNPTTCQTKKYTCPSNRRAFQNACGCGCELLSH